jgi:hypothetical protein
MEAHSSDQSRRRGHGHEIVWVAQGESAVEGKRTGGGMERVNTLMRQRHLEALETRTTHPRRCHNFG